MAADAVDNAGHTSNLLTVAQTAAELHKSERTIRRYILEGKLPTIAIGGATYVQMAGVDTGHVVARVSADDRQRPAQVDQQGADTVSTPGTMPGALSERLLELLMAQLAAKDAQIGDLTARVADLSATVGRLALPAGTSPTSPRPRGSVMGWLTVAALAAVAAALWWFALRPAGTGNTVSLFGI
jgi:hypothetical protein